MGVWGCFSGRASYCGLYAREMVKCIVPSTDVPGAVSMKFSTNGVDIDYNDDLKLAQKLIK